MKSIGIVCEFNPLHTGHIKLLNYAHELAECVVCVMSGEIVQRGEVALFDKWQRTRAALKAGADLVIELPAAYVLSSAATFAKGGVATLDKLGVEGIVFGSECGDIEKLSNYAIKLHNESEEFKTVLKNELDKGIPYPKAIATALGDDEFFTSNNILGIEYIKAILELNSKMKPYTMKRVGAEHNSDNVSDTVSGKYIRDCYQSGKIDDVKDFMPVAFENPRYTSSLSILILGHIRMYKKHAFDESADISEGIENRIIKAALKATSYDELLQAVSTKRYTSSKLRRILLNVALCVPQGLAFSEPTYARVLGFNSIGQAYLKSIKKTTTLDIVTKVADYKGNDKKFEYDLGASELASICEDVSADRDFTIGPQIL